MNMSLISNNVIVIIVMKLLYNIYIVYFFW